MPLASLKMIARYWLPLILIFRHTFMPRARPDSFHFFQPVFAFMRHAPPPPFRRHVFASGFR
jgi:hypothetical protein